MHQKDNTLLLQNIDVEYIDLFSSISKLDGFDFGFFFSTPKFVLNIYDQMLSEGSTILTYCPPHPSRSANITFFQTDILLFHYEWHLKCHKLILC